MTFEIITSIDIATISLIEFEKRSTTILFQLSIRLKLQYPQISVKNKPTATKKRIKGINQERVIFRRASQE